MLKSLLIPLAAAAGVLASEAADNATYDYIVVGTGPGGGPLAANLARAGMSVLLLEAGDDQSMNPNVSNLFQFNDATNDEKTRWDFWTKHSEDPKRELEYDHMVWRKSDGNFYVGKSPPAGSTQLGVWYPRAGTLGGCAMHNAGVTFLPYDDDWDDIVKMTGDKSWASAEMRKHFENIERNSYLSAKNVTGHGYSGYLDTMVVDSGWIDMKGGDGATIFKQLALATGQGSANLSTQIYRDINAVNPNRDEELGFYGLATHATKTGKRVGPFSFIKSTLADPKKYPLTLQLNSLVTKVLFSNDSSPTAVGVEVLQGKSMYAADPRYKKSQKGTTVKYYAKKEVIVSGGAFNSPQILKLSGIGPAAELKKFGIPVVKDLPGVGERLGDNYETSYIVMANGSYALKGVGAPVALLMKTPSPTKRRNIYAFCGAISFEGFWPGMPTDYGPSEFECAIVHMNPKSQAGYVRLRSADPQDTPDINFRFFEKDGDQDLTEMLDAVKVIRGAFEKVGAPMTPWNEVHPCKGQGRQCSDAEQKDFIKNQAYSHHPVASCAIGADSDPMAVLDSKFRVRGVKNLRVVDASAFPKIPGAFPVVPTMMLAEKATADILGKTA